MYNKKGWKYGKKVDGYLQINEIQRKMEKNGWKVEKSFVMRAIWNTQMIERYSFRMKFIQ